MRRVGRRVRGTPVSSPRHGGAWSSKPDDARRPNRPTRWRPSLCEIYWFPLYAYVRRQGQSTDDAQDLTQGFFAHLLDKQTLRAADRERGHFRSFLLASLKHFLAKQWRRDAAQKRGGGQLETSEGAVKVAIHRMRRRYRAILREEIRHTVDAAEDVDDELRRLFDAVTP